MRTNKHWLALIVAGILLAVFLPGALTSAQTPPNEVISSTRAATADDHALTNNIVIDGVFTGVLIDSDGTLSGGIGVTNTIAKGFIELKKFDVVDKILYQDKNGSQRADAGDAYWIDDGDGVFDRDDREIVGNPTLGNPGKPVNALKPYEEIAVAYNDAEINDNNQYNDGEDIYMVDSVDEFRGAMQRVIYDPLNLGSGQVLAHIYIANNTNTVFMHNDFIVDTEAVWIDGDGIDNPGSGSQEQIGFPVYANTITNTLDVDIFGRWFSTDDDVYWLSTGLIADTWNPYGDALWLDNDDDGVYSYTVDRVIIDTGEMSSGTIGRELNHNGPDPTYNFVYNDENNNGRWDSGEDISTLDGDETFDWNYFFDQWSWLVDGDGGATLGRGDEDLTRIDGNTWFQASDRVFHYDANNNGDWNDGDALWIDHDGDGIYHSAIDTMLVMSDTLTNGLTGKLLWVQFVDGDGDATEGDGSEYIPRRGQTSFALEDNVLWYDVPDSDNWFWSAGDGLWIDTDDDNIFTANVDRVIVRGSMTGGEQGTRLSPGAHHFGYDDGEVDLNGRYDPGEDIYAANTYLAYDDFEVNFNGEYDPGEDIYDRDYIQIWVYAEGETKQVPHDIRHPDLQPHLRDIGFRVHVNGIRIDDPADDYDAPTGFQAAAGWGPSRGAPLLSMAQATYNRHYEYKLTSASADAPQHLVSNGVRVDNAGLTAPASPNAPRVWESDHKIDWETCQFTWITHWKDLRRGRDNYLSFGSSSGQREETVLLDWLHPSPPPDPEPPLIIKEPLYGPLVFDPQAPFIENYCWSIFVSNPGDTPLGEINLRDYLPAGWFVHEVEIHPDSAIVEAFPGDESYIILLPEGLAPGDWVEIIICASGEFDPTAEAVTNIIEGEVDDDNDPATDPVPIPPESTSIPIITEPSIRLFKQPEDREVAPGERVTWRIGVVNTGHIPLNNAHLEDNLPEGLTPYTQTTALSPGTDLARDLGALGRGHTHIVRLETEVEAGLTPSTTLTNTLRLLGDFATSQTAVFPYMTTISATIHITEPGPKLAAQPYGTLCTKEGLPITDFALRMLLDAYIPDYHSTLLVFTQCYGGNMLDNFAERARTGTLSATSAEQRAIYNGYDNDAAGALKPEDGRTSDTVHQAGIDGKHNRETPQKIGPTIPLTPTSATGDIKSRHVLVYAGCPDKGGTWDSDQRNTIEANFAGESNTTVTSVGGDGAGGWDHAGTLTGLRNALEEIGQAMNQDEQFILFVTDHGDHHPAVQDVEIPAKATATVFPDVPGTLIRAMHLESDNNAGTGVTLYTPGVYTFTQGDIAISLPPATTVYTQFTTYRLDLDDDGDMETLGEGTYLVFHIPESELIGNAPFTDFRLEIDVENRTLDNMAFTYISMDSGPISKRPEHPIYLPLVLKN